MTIPASQIVQVVPNVIGAGGNPLALNALMLTQSGRPPLGQVLQFSDADSVGDYFGPTSQEAVLAGVYFGGFEGATQLPGALYVAQYNTMDVAAWLRSGSWAGKTVADLNLINDSLSVTVDGVVLTGTVNLTSVTSFSQAAGVIQTALNGATPDEVTVTYDSVLSAFLITSNTTGASSTITVGSGAAAALLLLTTATGAVTSQGAEAVTDPATVLDPILEITQNWASFFTAWEPVTAGKMLFADWVQGQNERWLYIGWDSTSGVAAAADPTSFGAQAAFAEMNGVFAIYDKELGKKAAFIAGIVGSIDFAATNGRITFAFKSQAGLVPEVTTSFVAGNLKANGYNYYADYATANDRFVFLQDGSIAGKWKWADSYVNQIQLNSAFQLAFMAFLADAKSVPYNAQGYSQLRAVALDPIDAAVNFGTIRPGIPLSNSQRAQVNAAVGLPVADTIEKVGWYLHVGRASAVVRGQRGSPPMAFYYTDGGSIQKIVLSSTNIQ